MRLPVLLVSLAVVVAAAPPTMAQGKKAAPKVDPRMAEAKKLFDEGAAAYAQGGYEEAIRLWEKSYDLSQKPLIFESIANAWERLGDARKAREFLARWREAAPAEERELLTSRLKNLDARVEREEEAARRAAEEKARREADEKAAAESKRKMAWLPGGILAGTGGAVVVAGLTLGAVGKGKQPGADECRTTGGATYCKSSAADAIKAGSTLATVGDALWIGGAAIAATGVVLLIVLPRRASEEKPATAWVTPVPGGIAAGGTF